MEALMPRSSPTTLTLPPFEGAVRTLVLANVAIFFVLSILLWLVPGIGGWLVQNLALEPLRAARGELWQFGTYSFIELGILPILFNMVMLWFIGNMLEGAYGRRWLMELYFSSAVGGAILASILSFTQVLHLSPLSSTGGASAALLGLLVAVGMRFGDQEFFLWFLIRIRAKYLVAIVILIDVAVLLKSGDTFAVLLNLAGGFCGFLYVSYAPRRGMAFGFSEQYFGLRNSYYRYKRRRAARKFEVYMGKQGRKVNFDSEGRYIDPDELKKDPNDKRWMN
jgi:membrane associated rhomboid family serine protease